MESLEHASWLWTAAPHSRYHTYQQFRRRFSLSEADFAVAGGHGGARLTLAADSYYQVWLNGDVVGHGPAKSAANSRSFDEFEISRWLRTGDNELLITVLSVGTGTMTYCPGEPGLIFAVTLPAGRLVSDTETEVREVASRRRRTVRRWLLPCIEDVDLTAPEEAWAPATIVTRKVSLYRRRVPLPSRRRRGVSSLLLADVVTPPNVTMSVRVRPYLVADEDATRCNIYRRPAYIVADLQSPVDQQLKVYPSLGNVTWYLNGEQLLTASGWGRQAGEEVNAPLHAGANRLLGALEFSHTEDVSFVGHCEQDIEWSNPFGDGPLQLCPAPDGESLCGDGSEPDWAVWQSAMPTMDPADIMGDGNAQDLVIYAQRRTHLSADPIENGLSAGNPGLLLAGAPAGSCTRYIVDLGSLANGWLAFEAEGSAGSILRFSFFETTSNAIPGEFGWALNCNNALTYRLTDGRQQFESFHAYGARYIAVLHSGSEPVILHHMALVDASCLGQPTGRFCSSDPLLDRIYADCVQALRGGVDDTYTDGPTAEQANWNVDNRLAAMGELLSYHNTAICRNSIQLFAEDDECPGLVRGCAPGTWDVQIPLWSLHWIMWCADYVRATDDVSFANAMYPQVRAGLDDALAKRNAVGLLELREAWHFVEWCDGRDDNHPVNCAEQAGLCGALAAGVELARRIGPQHDDEVESWTEARAELVAAINEHLWDPAVRAYADALVDGGLRSPFVTATTNAMCCLYGIPNVSRRQEVLHHLRGGGDSVLYQSDSLYHLYYLLAVFDQENDARNVIHHIRRWWEARIRDRRWGSSDEPGARGPQHPAAAFVLRYLIKYCLGVRMAEPGFAAFRVVPAPLDLDYCQGTVPTPRGLVRVSWQRHGHDIAIDVEHPGTIRRLPSKQ